MWRREDVLRELKEEGLLELGKNENSGGLPPGFRFHPTDEELITFYLASKVFNTRNHLLSDSGAQIVEVDLTRCEPWDLPERAKMGEREWYLYSLRDRKYPSGLRTNRATETGYWKATGKDRQVYATGITTAAGGAGGVLIGIKKTLVFYQGRAPRGVKTPWVMHEYRLDGHFSSFRLSSKEEWVICRVFHKNGEKKNPPIINAPPLSPPLPPPALSPFLNCLPQLQEPPATTQVAADTQRSLHNANYDLLHALLSSPLPNFSSISGSDTNFPPTNATLQTTATPNAAALASMSASSTLSKTFHHPFPQPKHLPSLTSTTLNCQQHPHHWPDKICPQVNNQHQYHHHHNSLNYDMMDPVPNNYAIAPHDGNDDGDDEVTAVHHADMSPSLAVAALDRMLNDNINHPPAQSWTFHP